MPTLLRRSGALPSDSVRHNQLTSEGVVGSTAAALGLTIE
jgi:hypothetical protein